jgi:hypothetical protein
MTYISDAIYGTKSTDNSSSTNVGGYSFLTSGVNNSTDPVIVSVQDGSLFTAGQTIKINSEYLIIGSVSVNDLLNCTRNEFNSTIEAHSTSDVIYGVYIGTSELNSQPDVMVSLKTDVSGIEYFDFSNDNVLWDAFPVSGFSVNANIHEFHVAVKGKRYFRIRFENSNDSNSASTTFNINTYYGVFRQGNVPLNQSINNDSDSVVVRAVNAGSDPTGLYTNIKVDGSGFRTTDNLQGTLIDNVSGYTSGETTSIIVDSTTNFPSSGYICIGGEYISYTSKTATTFDTLTRGEFNTTANSISNNAVVGEAYDSGVLTLDGYTEVATKILCSNTGTMKFIWYSDSTGTDAIRSLSPTYSEVDTYDYLAAPNFGPYVRYVFANTDSGGANTTDFYFETEFYTKSISAQILTLNSSVLGGMTSSVTRSILVGQQEGTTNYANVLTTTNNEILTNTLASNRKSRAVYKQNAINADSYIIMVDLSDTTNYPHAQTGSINIDHFTASINFNSGTAQATINLGVITRIDGTDADITYLINDVVGVQSANDTQIINYNYQPSAVSFKVVGGALVGAVSNNIDENIASVNTGLTLQSSRNATITPAVGDIILKLEYVADDYDATISILYHSKS